MIRGRCVNVVYAGSVCKIQDPSFGKQSYLKVEVMCEKWDTNFTRRGKMGNDERDVCDE